jgi:hypothetical protein
MLFTTKKKETDNDNRGGDIRRDDLRAPAVDANTMPIEIIDIKMQLDKFLCVTPYSSPYCSHPHLRGSCNVSNQGYAIFIDIRLID